MGSPSNRYKCKHFRTIEKHWHEKRALNEIIEVGYPVFPGYAWFNAKNSSHTITFSVLYDLRLSNCIYIVATYVSIWVIISRALSKKWYKYTINKLFSFFNIHLLLICLFIYLFHSQGNKIIKMIKHVLLN